MNQSFCKLMLPHFQKEFRRAVSTHALRTQPAGGTGSQPGRCGGSQAEPHGLPGGSIRPLAGRHYRRPCSCTHLLPTLREIICPNPFRPHLQNAPEGLSYKQGKWISHGSGGWQSCSGRFAAALRICFLVPLDTRSH